MLRRLVSEDRLDRGLWESSSDRQKFNMLCGGPCFFFWCWATSLLFASMLNFNRVLSQEMVIEVGCEGKAEVKMAPDGLHHITGCKFKQEHFDGQFHLKVGDFYISRESKGCGATADMMRKGQLHQGTPVSFLGNASDGVLKPWIKNRARVCGFEEGPVAAPIQVMNISKAQRFGTFLAMIFVFTFLYMSSACLFFPEADMDRGTRCLRCMAISFIALIASCFSSTLSFYYGESGLYIGAVILSLLFYIGFSQGCLECLQKRNSADQEDPNENDEEQPLLPDSQEQATPAYAAVPASADDAAPPPAVDASSTRNEPEPDSQAESGSTHQGGGKELLIAVVLGIAGGLLGGVLISLLLVSMSGR